MSAKRVEYHQGAIADVKSAVAWYRKRSRKVASGFHRRTGSRRRHNPRRPERWPIGNNNTRRFLLWRFPFSIIYSEQASTVTIWAVAHGSRRPEYWARRL
jgi:toxin ParE1/3/4